MIYPSRIFLMLFIILCGLYDLRADEVDDYIQASMRRQHIPGLSLVIIREGRVIKARGYGMASIELSVPATPETVYDLASLTKPFIAEAIMLLVQEGQIGLEDKIGRYIKNVPASWDGITVRHLLSHTSGIKDYLADLRHDFLHDTPPEKMVEFVMDSPLNFAPGEKWSYSNTGYILLGMIISQVTGKNYHEYLSERIFKPLAMKQTRRQYPDDIVPHRASGYLWYGSGGMHNGDFLKYLMANHGDRGLLSSVLDLAKWDMALLSDNQLLTPSSLKQMWTPVPLNDGTTSGYGLGWFIEDLNGHRHISHPGGAPGTETILSRYPEDKLTIIVMTNGGATYVQALDRGIAQCFISDLKVRGVVKLNPAILDSYAGYYNAFGSQLLKVSREKGALALDDGGRLTNLFIPLSETKFVAEDADRGFTINREIGGEITSLRLRLQTYQTNVQRIGPLASSLTPQPDPNPDVTHRIEAVLKAFAQSGAAVMKSAGVAPQAQKDYAGGSAPELVGIRSISFIAVQNMAGRGIERHDGKVSQILYYRLFTVQGPPRYVLIYLTPDGLVTDQDVVTE